MTAQTISKPIGTVQTAEATSAEGSMVTSGPAAFRWIFAYGAISMSVLGSTNAGALQLPVIRPVLPLIQTNSGEWRHAMRRSEQSQQTPASAIMELRRVTGLTWDQLARLFDVDRRSLHFWASGKPLNSANEERLQQLVAAIRKVDRGSAGANRMLLLGATESGATLFELLVNGQFNQMVSIAGAGQGRVEVQSSPLSVQAKAERQPSSPAELVGALQDRVHVPRGRLRSATPIRPKRES